MPERPAGTDGSDHGYRMLIQDRYRRMAFLLSAASKLVWIQLASVALKSAYLLTPYFVDGGSVPVWAYTIFLEDVVAVVLWLIANPRKSNNLFLTKLCSGAFLLVFATIFVTLMKYQMMTHKEDRYPTRLLTYLRVYKGPQPSWMFDVLVAVEAGLEVFQLLAVGATCYALHTYIKQKMEFTPKVSTPVARESAPAVQQPGPRPAGPMGANRRRRA